MSTPRPDCLTTAGQHLGPRDPSAPARPARLACSSVDLLWVMSYAPGTGFAGTPIAVNFACKTDLATGAHIRLVVGRRAVATRVRETDAPGCGRWQLTGNAPAFAKQRSPSAMVPLTIQAVDKDNHVVDSVTFGDFVYRDAAPQDATLPLSPPSRPALRIVPTDTADRPSKRHSPYSQPQSPPSSDSDSPPARTPALRRASRQLGADTEDAAHTVVLDITTPLDDFCFDWEESELHAGRRLVRFHRIQDGNRLIVSAERVSQAEYDPDDIVISCIYREETDACCVTSVDIIHLLQRLVDADFEVDEKNRIRRNLEGLRPTTVSKARPGFESFFQRIMDFPDPKPRKIEKDVKVFDWKLLPHALDKILSKYSLCVSPTPNQPASSPFATSPSQVEPSSAGAYGDSTFRLPPEPHLDALYLSPVVQLSSFTPDASPEMQRRPSLHDEQLHPLYVDAELMQRYFSEPDMSYRVPPPMYTVESPTTLVHDSSAFVGNQVQHGWATQPADPMLASPQELVYPHPYGYSSSGSAEHVDIYAAPSYPVNTYDSFEFQTLREHNSGAVLTSQHA